LTFPSNYTIDLRFFKEDVEEKGLDWGFAGQILTSGDTQTFVHFVDSRYADDPLAVQDIGVFSALPNGDELETGEMMNPACKRKMKYEEVWRKLTLSGPGGGVCLEALDGSAFLGRVGKWFQGIYVEDGETTAVRYILQDDGEWKKVRSVGQRFDRVPLTLPDDSKDWTPGQVVTVHGVEWLVRDVQRDA